MIICGDRRNLQKDKYYCNTPPIQSLWLCSQTQSSPQWRNMKTHLKFAKKKHLKDPQTLRNKIIWSDEPQFKTSCLKETRHCSSPAEYHRKSKVWWCSLMLIDHIYIYQKYSKYSNIRITINSCWQSWFFTAITSVFSVTWSFRNHSDLVLKKYFKWLILTNKCFKSIVHYSSNIS